MITTAARIPACTTPGHTAPSTRTILGTWIVVAVAIGAYLVRSRSGLIWTQRVLGG